MDNKIVLITGGAGFIGSNLAKHIEKKFSNVKIIIFDIFNNNEKFKNGNNKYLGSYKNISNFKGEIFTGDITKKADLIEMEKYNFDYIFHLAAISDTRAENENEVLINNLNSFYSIINLAEKTNAKLIYASSAATYGSKLSQIQSVGTENPDNVYGFSKLMMDNFTFSYLNNNPKIDLIGLRYFNVYGPGEKQKEKTSYTILLFAHQILYEDGPILFEGSDKIFRDFIYIDDVIEFTIKAALSSKVGVYNVGTGISRSFLEVAQILKKSLNSKKTIKYIKNPYKSGYQYFTKADVKKTVIDLDYKAKESLESGIQKYIKLF